MDIIYTTQRYVNTPKEYQQWLKSLKEGDLVVTQEFCPPGKNDDPFDLPFP